MGADGSDCIRDSREIRGRKIGGPKIVSHWHCEYSAPFTSVAQLWS
jgi:hypothetical protein